MKSISMSLLLASTSPEEAMVCITGISILVTALVGFLAWFNGHRATVIAEDAGNRDQAHRDRELLSRAYEARERVAIALITALNAVDTTSSKSRSREPEARGEEDKRVDEALALFTLVKSDIPATVRREWFMHIVRHMRGFTVPGSENESAYDSDLRAKRYSTARNAVLQSVTSWVQDPNMISELLHVDFKGPLTRGSKPEVCSGTLFGSGD